MAAATRSGLVGALAAAIAGCAAAPAPERGAPRSTFAVSSADEAYGGCADPVRLSPAPPADAAAALALVEAFVAQLRGPDGAPVRARRLGLGACDGLAGPGFSLLDFWIVGDRTIVFAPLAPGAPAAPAGLSLLVG
jgi:hypothetical protein